MAAIDSRGDAVETCPMADLDMTDPRESGWRGLSRRALDTILPPRCLACGGGVALQGALCPACWDQIQFLAPPHCAVCGYPFEVDLGPEALCPACVKEAPAYDRARAVLAYNAASRRLLLSFKHGDRTEGAPPYAAWLARAGAALIEDAELIVPVPLHRVRLFLRRYNQSALLAHALGRATGLPVATRVLRRRRNTPSQGRMSAQARWRNVAGAFAVDPGRRPDIEKRRVLLLDDVMTSGATVSACAQTLRRAGAAGVDVLVLARVLRSES